MCEGKFLVRTKVLDNVIRQVTVENFRFGVCVSKKPEGGWISQDLNNYYSKKKKRELKRALLLELKQQQQQQEYNNPNIKVFSSDTDCCINSISSNKSSTSFIQNRVTATTTTTLTCTPLLENSREDNELHLLDVAHKGSSLSTSPASLSRPVIELDEEKEKCDSEGKESKERKDEEKVKESSNKSTSINSSSKTEQDKIEIWDAKNEKHRAILNDFFYRDYKKFSDKKQEYKSASSSSSLSLSSSSHITTSHSTTNSILYKHLKNKSISKNNNNTGNSNNLQYTSSSSSASTPSLSSSTKTVYKNNRTVPLLLTGNLYAKLIRKQQQQQQKKVTTSNTIPNFNSDNSHNRHLTTIQRNLNFRNQKIPSDKNREISQYLSNFFGKSPLLKLQLLNLLVVPKPSTNTSAIGVQRGPATICANTPDLIHISRLKNMLFDDDGKEKSGEVSVVNMPGEQQERTMNNNNNSNSTRVNDIEFDDEDPLEVIEAKRVKIEKLDDDDDLIIDENALDGHQPEQQQQQQDVEMSESSNDCNLETSSLFSITEVTSNATTNDLLDNRNVNNDNDTSKNDNSKNNTGPPSSISEIKRPSSASSHTSTSSVSSQQKKTQNVTNSNDLIDKNGHDTNVSQVPTSKNKMNTSNSNQNTKYNSNKFDECNNAASSSSSLSSNNSVDSNNTTTTTTTTTNSMENKVLQLEKEILSLTTLLKAKEKEWNAIIRLKKLKELTLEIYRRQKDVNNLKESESNPQFEDFTSLLTKISSEREKIGLGENETRLNLEKTEKDIKEEEKRLKIFYNDTDDSATIGNSSKKDNISSNSGSTIKGSATTTKQTTDSPSTASSTEQFKASLALQQLCERNRSSISQTNHSTSNLLQNKVIGEGRQGTIVEVKSIIAHHHRSKNSDDAVPNQSQENKPKKPRRAPATNSNALVSILPQNPNIKYMDILVSLAQSHNENHGKSVANTITPFENITTSARSITKSNSNLLNSSSSGSSSIQQQVNAFNSSSGSSTGTSRQLQTTLAKLLSSNSTVSVPGHVSQMDEGTLSTRKFDAGNHSERDNNSLSLASLLASSTKKGREEELKHDDDDSIAPVCQGCGTNRAQFVCAGCANQWYCSRECQVSAWDEHSEICSG